MYVLPSRSFKLFTFPCRHGYSLNINHIKARSQLHSNHLVEIRVEVASNWDTMTKFACAHCEHTYAHRRNLTYHMKSKHPDVSVERKVRGAGKKVKTGLGFKCDQCGYLFTERRSLNRKSQGIIQII